MGDRELPGADDPITLIGLIFETATGLRRVLSPGLEGEIGVGGQSFELLIRLARSDGGRLRMSDLAAQAGLSPSGLTRAVDRLVEAGLLARETCPNDRRGAFAQLTALGSERMREALGRHHREVADLLDGVLDPGSQEQLAELLRPLRNRVHPEATVGSAPTAGGSDGCFEPAPLSEASSETGDR